MKQDDLLPTGNKTKEYPAPNLHRRKFLINMGVAGAAITGLAACTKTDNSMPLTSQNADNAAAGSFTDIDILNYAYLLEQLEASFYIMVTNNFYSGATALEKKRLEQVRDHEIAHREFFKTALGSSAIPDQQFDFSSVDFSSRTSVLTTSKTFEDTGVSAYNGVAYALMSPDYLLVAGKIVSVEARHAAYFRDLLDPLSFADNSVVNSNGLDLAAKPKDVVQTISPYLTSMPNMKSLFSL